MKEIIFTVLTLILGLIGGHSLIFDYILLDYILAMSLGMALSGLLLIADWNSPKTEKANKGE